MAHISHSRLTIASAVSTGVSTYHCSVMVYCHPVEFADFVVDFVVSEGSEGSASRSGSGSGSGSGFVEGSGSVEFWNHLRCGFGF